VERHHWVNTVVGLLDAVWHLSLEERVWSSRIVGGVLDELRIPERGPAAQIPAHLAYEVEVGRYGRLVNGDLDSGVEHRPRPATPSDHPVPFDVWRQTFVSLFTTAYPDLDGVERVFLTKVFGELLTAIGVGPRAAQFVPDDVVRIARNP
jgi:hypothetical protein